MLFSEKVQIDINKYEPNKFSKDCFFNWSKIFVLSLLFFYFKINMEINGKQESLDKTGIVHDHERTII